jgi:photosystem II stability/assembly factor-like uncharacterized protein
MRRYFFIPLFLFLFTGQFYKTYAQDYWFELNSPTTNFLSALHFADSLTGWVAGDSGLILYTSNGGLDWIEQQTNTNNNIKDIFFLDENRGWAIAWKEYIPPIGTMILSTTNGGIDWVTEDYREENVFIKSIYFLDTLNGFMGGYPSEFVRTMDGGILWEDVTIDTVPLAYFPVVNFNFYNHLYGYACGGALDIAGVIWRTVNGGEFWTVLGASGDPEFFGASIMRTSNGGDDWMNEELGIFGVATSLSFRTKSEGWAPLSFAQTMMYSLDTGITWTEIPTVNDLSIYELVFTDTLTGYAVGSQGAIIKYKYPNTTPYVEQGQSLPSEFKLFQNYPNPFNPVTTINYIIPFGCHVQLTVYDPLGNKVAVLEDTYRQRGSYKTIWNADNFSTGIYYYQLKVGSYIDTRKMILLK